MLVVKAPNFLLFVGGFLIYIHTFTVFTQYTASVTLIYRHVTTHDDGAIRMLMRVMLDVAHCVRRVSYIYTRGECVMCLLLLFLSTNSVLLDKFVITSVICLIEWLFSVLHIINQCFACFGDFDGFF